MGLIYADIEIVKSDDLALVRAGYLTSDKVRSFKTKALVDSGAYMMCINEDIRAQLDLPQIDEMTAELANGHSEKLAVVGPLEIRFKNRKTSCNAAVLPGNTEVLLGSIPMEDMDIVLNLKAQTIEVNPESPFIAKKKMK
jgi:clan AA aspartic protease